MNFPRVFIKSSVDPASFCRSYVLYFSFLFLLFLVVWGSGLLFLTNEFLQF